MDQNPYQVSDPDGQQAPSSPRSNAFMAWVCAAVCLLALLPITAVVAFVLGGIAGQTDLYHRRAADQARQMRAFVEQHEDRFSDLTIEEASDGWSYFTGKVKSQEDLDALQAEMQRLFGEELGRRMTSVVEVAREQPEDQAGRTSD